MSLPPGTFFWLSGVGLSNVMLPNNPESIAVAVWLYGNLSKHNTWCGQVPMDVCLPSTPLMGDPNR